MTWVPTDRQSSPRRDVKINVQSQGRHWSCLALLGLATLGSGCSSNLTRSNAAQLIQEKFKFPQYEEEDLVIFKRGSDLTNMFAPLASEGLVTIKMDPPWSNPYALSWMLGPTSRASLTDKGKQLATGEPFVPLGTASETYGPLAEAVKVKYAIIEFGEITGITAGDASTSVVDYTLVKKPTPFGKAFNFTAETRTTYHAEFKKYDDGWRAVR